MVALLGDTGVVKALGAVGYALNLMRTTAHKIYDVLSEFGSKVPVTREEIVSFHNSPANTQSFNSATTISSKLDAPARLAVQEMHSSKKRSPRQALSFIETDL